MADAEVKKTATAPSANAAGKILKKKELKRKRIAKLVAKKKANLKVKREEVKKNGAKKPKIQNYKLSNGVLRYSKNKHGVAKQKPIPRIVKKKRKQSLFIKKKVGSEKTGGTRIVRIRKMPNYFSLNPAKKQRPRGYKIKYVRKVPTLRSSLKPGTVCILLTGKHRGKRVVFLKQLRVTGLMLVTGPYFINKVPLRRISQKFVIATKTRIDISKVKIPVNVRDHLFRRQKKKAPKDKVKKSEAGDLFEVKKKQKYVPTAERKKAQAEVDKQVMKAIKARPDKRFMCGYLKTKFSLSHGTYPHRLVF